MGQINNASGNTLLESGMFPPCRVATTAAITLSGLQVVDGVALQAGNRVLVWMQGDPRTNGIYAASTGNWLRTTDARSTTQFFQGMAVMIALGATYSTVTFQCSCPDDPVVIGTSAITFSPAGKIVSTTLPPHLEVNANVMHPAYGAIGNNVVDDTAAFLRCAAANPIIYLPYGHKFKLSGPVTVTQGVVGDSAGVAVLRQSVPGSKTIIVTPGANAPLLTNFSIVYENDAGAPIVATTGATGLDISGGTVNGAIVQNILVSGASVGVALGPTDHGAIANVVALNCRSHGFFRQPAGGSGTLQWQMENCLAANNAGSGFLTFAQAGSGAGQITLGEERSLQTFANGGNGIAYLGRADCPINGIRLRQPFVGADGTDEIVLDTFSTGIPHLIESPFCELAGQFTTGPTFAAASGVGGGIDITANNGIVNIASPQICNNSGDGIVSAAGRLTVTDGIIITNGLGGVSQRGILINAGRAIIKDCTIGGISGGATQTYGIALATAGIDHCVIEGNDLRNNSVAGILYLSTGTSNRIVDNDGWNPVGVTVPTAGASPWTYTAGPTPEVLMIRPGAGGSIPSITYQPSGFVIIPNPVTTTVPLAPNQQIIIAWATTAPVIVRSIY